MNKEIIHEIDEIISILKTERDYTLKLYEHIGDGIIKAIIYKRLMDTTKLAPARMNELVNCLVSNKTFKHAMMAAGYTSIKTETFSAFPKKKCLASLFESILGWCYVNDDIDKATRIAMEIIMDRVQPFFSVMFDDLPVTEKTHVFVYENILYILEYGQCHPSLIRMRDKVIAEYKEYTARIQVTMNSIVRKPAPLHSVGVHWPRTREEVRQLFEKAGFDEGIR